MKAKTFKLQITTPNGEVFAGDVNAVKLEAEGGVVKTLAHHADFTATLIASPVVVTGEDFEDLYIARQGVYFFNNATNSATLMALEARSSEPFTEPRPAKSARCPCAIANTAALSFADATFKPVLILDCV